MDKFVQTVRYAVFLCSAARAGLTWPEVRRRVMDARADRSSSLPEPMRLVRDVIDRKAETETAVYKQVSKIWNEVENTFPILSLDAEKRMVCDEALLSPLVAAANEIVVQHCHRKGVCLSCYSEYTDCPPLPFYPLCHIRQGCTNVLVGVEVPAGQDAGKPEQTVLRFVDMSQDFLLLQTAIPFDRKSLKYFDGGVLEILRESVADASFRKKILGTSRTLSAASLKILSDALRQLNVHTLYKIGVREVMGDHGQKHLEWAACPEEGAVLMHFYCQRLRFAIDGQDRLQIMAHIIPSRLYKGKNTDSQLLFSMSRHRVREELQKLMHGCTMPVAAFSMAVADDVAESHLRKRQHAQGYIIEDAVLKSLYLEETQVEMEEHTYVLENRPDIASGFLEAVPNERGQLCIYWQKEKER